MVYSRTRHIATKEQILSDPWDSEEDTKTGLTVIEGGLATGDAKQDRPGLLPNGLTAKQDAFCLAVVKGATQSDAYREAYNAEGMKASSVHREASVLMVNPKITSRLVGLFEKKEAVALHSTQSRRIWIEQQLKKEAGDMASTPAARVRSLELLGKIAGVDLFREISGDAGTVREAEEVEEAIRDLLAKADGQKDGA